MGMRGQQIFFGLQVKIALCQMSVTADKARNVSVARVAIEVRKSWNHETTQDTRVDIIERFAPGLIVQQKRKAWHCSVCR